ncbi:unnamed protein product [Medioppia subpectinata]|uniref:EamA domain-containing protein n=1 Tax=Medioppia subpectinata TaxID=1979941 RepID=A0A7R9KS42_9ACAR|nr:unnamed protein product [Medioppia subpectinata]CAG2108753.1 unnamed protein product [Medioppia subpectinata]
MKLHDKHFGDDNIGGKNVSNKSINNKQKQHMVVVDVNADTPASSGANCHNNGDVVKLSGVNVAEKGGVLVAQNKQSLTDRIANKIPAFGIILMALSATSYSLGSLIIKLLPELHSLEVLFFRCVIQFLFNLVYALWQGQSVGGVPGHRFDLFMRGVWGTVSSMGSFMAFALIPLSDATTIQFSSPVFVTLFAYFLLREPLTILQVLTGTITLSGVVIITRPKMLFTLGWANIPDGHIEGLLSAIMGAFGNAMAIITLRKLKQTPVAVVVVWYSVAIIVGTVVTLVAWDAFTWPVGWRAWLLLLAIGVTGVGDQLFMTVALRYESAGPASIARSLTIVLAFVWDILVLNGTFNGTAALGAALVSTGVIILGAYKWSQEKPELFDRLRFKLCGGTKVVNLE